MDRYIGMLLDNRYEILEVIGRGGMAVVYKATCHRLNRPVAVKILKDEYSRDAEFRRRFHAESQAVAMLSHPNIVNVYDVSHTDDCDYIVMELIDGITLKQYLEQKGTLSWREVLHFAPQICKAIEHAHNKGVIHRDIKPHNVMVLKDGSVKVADFGIARMTSAQNTLTREALGSVHYISPEQAKGGKVDCRTDLYSLGVVMYEMLAGKPPFDGETPVSVAIQHIHSTPAALRTINPSIPEGLEQIVMRAMRADPNARYQNATQMLEDLEKFRQDPAVLFEESKQERAAADEEPAQKPEPIRSTAQKTEKKYNSTTILAGVLGVLLAVTGLAALIVAMFHNNEIRVPDLRETSVDTLEKLYGDRFKFEVAEWVFDDKIPYGFVVSQEPKPKTSVKADSTISVTASLGVQKMSMPNLVNYSVIDAQTILGSFDVQVSVSYEESDIYVQDYVIRTTPSYGEALSPGQQVELTVSKGKNTTLCEVPELTGMDVDEALQKLDELKLGKGNIKYVENELPKGTVTFQSIKQGTAVKEGTIINLQVSQGAEKKTQIPSIEIQPGSVTVEQGEVTVLSVAASVSDGGTLSYEWFFSETGSATNMQSVGTGESLSVDTSAIGAKSYCCKITNTLGDAPVSIYSNMAKVTVTEAQEPVVKDLTLAIPAGEGDATILVKLDGANYTEPFTVDRNDETMVIEIEAYGSHQVDVYVDGLLWHSRTMDFT